MTSKVTIDAHAGWPIHVEKRSGEPGTPDVFTVEIVEPNTKKDFYIHSGMSILGIKELPRE